MEANFAIKEEKMSDDEVEPMVVDEEEETKATPAGPQKTWTPSEIQESLVITALLKCMTDFPQGFTTGMIQSAIPKVPLPLIAPAIQNFMALKRIAVFQKDGQLMWKVADGYKLKGANAEENIILDHIKAAGNQGILSILLRKKSNLMQPALNKVLKSLIEKKLVKAVSAAVPVGKGKIYMLNELEPDRAITGGSWYSKNNEFEIELVELLYAQTYRLLLEKTNSARTNPLFTNLGPLHVRNASEMTSEEMFKIIMGLGIIKVDLEFKEFEQVLQTLIYDGKVEKTGRVSSKGEIIDVVYKYRSVNSPITSAGAVRIPCGVCPIIEKCHPTVGSITPNGCDYMDEWLQ